MKFSIAMSQQGVKFQPLAIKGSLEEVFKKVSNLGYSAVEIAIKDADEVNQDELKALLEKYNLSVSALGTGLIYFEDKLSLTDEDKDKRKHAINRAKKHIKLAKELSCFVVIGLVRGKGEDKKEDIEKRLLSSLFKIVDFAEKQDVKLLLEPINRYETNLINNTDEAISFIEKINSKNLGILFDTFHANIEEKDILSAIKKCEKYLWHIHLADSNRYAPGLGHIDFKGILNGLDKIKYSGYYSFEILPYPTSDEATKNAIEYIKRIKKIPTCRQQFKNPATTVDIIIEMDGGMVLIKRKNEPFKNKWALPGGFVEYGEQVEEAAIREAEEETGLKIKLKKLLGVYSAPDRDPRGHTISCIFVAEKIGGSPLASTDAKEVKIVKYPANLEFAFDHKEILEDYFQDKK